MAFTMTSTPNTSICRQTSLQAYPDPNPDADTNPGPDPEPPNFVTPGTALPSGATPTSRLLSSHPFGFDDAHTTVGRRLMIRKVLSPSARRLLPSLCSISLDPKGVAPTHASENLSAPRSSVCYTATEVLAGSWSLTDVLRAVDKSLTPAHQNPHHNHERHLRALEARVSLACACGRAVVCLMENLHAVDLCHLLVPPLFHGASATAPGESMVASLLFVSASDVRIWSAAHVRPIGTPCPAKDKASGLNGVYGQD